MDKRVIVFDFETTGLCSLRDEVIEIGAIEYLNGKETRRFHDFACPSKEMRKSISKIHGLTTESLKGRQSSIELISSFLEWTRSFSGTLMVAHNIQFDLKFLELGIDILNKRSRPFQDYPESKFCTFLHLKKLYKKPFSLDNACKLLKISYESKRVVHCALTDAELTAQVYFSLINLYPN